MSCSILDNNLLRLEASQPGFAAMLRGRICAAGVGHLRGPATAPVDCAPLRSATLVYLGVDPGLRGIVESLNGEINLLVVEPDAGRVLSLLSRLDHPALCDPRKVRWVLSMEQLEQQQLGDFCLGGVQVISAPRREPTALDLALMRKLRELLLAQQRQRCSSRETYFTMVTYNRLMLTRLTLDRLALNTDAPLRLVIIDNASTDGTRRWLRENSARYPFIERVIQMDHNLGIGRALNNGMVYSLARSDRVGRLDNDILVPPGWLRDLNQVLNSSLRPMVVCGHVTDDAEVKKIIAAGQQTRVDDLRVFLVETIGGCCNVYDPQLFAQLGFFPEEPLYGVEDGGICKAARDAGRAVAVVDAVKLEHLTTLFPDADSYMSFKGDQVDEWRRGGGEPSAQFGMRGVVGLTGDRGFHAQPGARSPEL